MKMEQMGAVGRRSLGKNSDVIAVGQDVGYLLVDDAGVSAATATQEHGFATRRQQADQRPVTNLFLRNKGRRQNRIDDEDIDPRDMVGDDESAWNGFGQIRIEPDTERIDDTAGGAGFQTLAGSVAADRKKTKSDNEGPDHRQRKTKQPEGA